MSVIRNLKGLGLLLAALVPVLFMAGPVTAQDTNVTVTTGGPSPAPAPVPVTTTGTTSQTVEPAATPGELPPLPASASQGKSSFESEGNFESVERPEMATFADRQSAYQFQKWSETWKDGKYVPPPQRKSGAYYNQVYAFAGIAAGQSYYLESHYPKKKKPATAIVGKTADGTDLYDIGAFGSFHYYTRIR